MGTFEGHASAGSFFVIFSTWWTVQIFRRYHRCEQKNQKFRSSVSFDWKADNFVIYPIEDVLKIVCSCSGILGEIIGGSGGTHFPDGNVQHITMYAFFCFSAIIDILVIKNKLPKYLHLHYVTVAFAFAIELFLFTFHQIGDDRIEVLVHKLLLLANCCTLLCCILEALHRNMVLAALGRTYFVMIQGTWFIHIGFILYNPLPNAVKWNFNNNGQIMTIVTLFSWHCIADFLGMFFIGMFIWCKTKGKSEGGDVYKRLTEAIHVEDEE